MKDTAEYKAEQYAAKKCINCIRYYCNKQNKKGNGSIDYCNEYLFRKKHYLAGLEDGEPKLHYPQSNPEDLPPKDNKVKNLSKPVLCVIEIGHTFYEVARFYYPDKTWKLQDNDGGFSFEQVVAWYELPSLGKNFNGK